MKLIDYLRQASTEEVAFFLFLLLSQSIINEVKDIPELEKNVIKNLEENKEPFLKEITEILEADYGNE